MATKRVFKTKTFSRWAKGLLPDVVLCEAALDIEQGRFEADLGGGVCKKRIALPGMGKSGGTRTLVAKQNKLALFFMTGRSKSDPGTDFSSEEIDVVKSVAASFHAASVAQIEILKTVGAVKEICNDQTAR